MQIYRILEYSFFVLALSVTIRSKRIQWEFNATTTKFQILSVYDFAKIYRDDF